MDIYSLGHSSFRVKGKNATVVTDPFDSQMVGLKFPKVDQVDVISVSHDHGDHNAVSAVTEKLSSDQKPFVISGPGEYEIKGVTIVGVPTFHDEVEGEKRGKNTVYVFSVDGVKVCHLGDLGHKLDEQTVSEIGDVDILLIPVGGNFTINAKTAAEVVTQIEPSVIIPMHYKRGGMKAELASELAEVSDFLKEMGAEGVTPAPKYSVSKDKLPETTTVVVLE